MLSNLYNISPTAPKVKSTGLFFMPKFGMTATVCYADRTALNGNTMNIMNAMDAIFMQGAVGSEPTWNATSAINLIGRRTFSAGQVRQVRIKRRPSALSDRLRGEQKFATTAALNQTRFFSGSRSFMTQKRTPQAQRNIKANTLT